MDAIEQIRQMLQSYPLLSYHQDGNTFIVAPASANGFSASLTFTGDGFVVSFDGWHEHFESEVDAFNCFVFGLSDQCRLKVFRSGMTDYRWTLEHLTEEGWHEESTTRLLFFPFWRQRHIIYRQNTIIENGGVSSM